MELFDIPVRTIDGRDTTLAEHRGKVLVIVNVASRCGFRGQYAGLEDMYRKWKDRGLVVLGFPCNQFAGQEPKSEADIQEFCSVRYEVTFPMYSKVDVNGPATDPLYQHLKSARRGTLGTRAIKWNFTKFLVDRDGNVVARFGPFTSPDRVLWHAVQLL